jgi:hypothetical protein
MILHSLKTFEEPLTRNNKRSYMDINMAFEESEGDYEYV